MTISRTFLAFIFCSKALFACTGLNIQAADRSCVNGRTVEFGEPLDLSVAVIPRNTTFTAETPLGKGMTYKSKYAVIGAYCFDKIVLMDGMNEKGLSAGAFYFPGYASYVKTTKQNQSKALSPLDFTNWLLTQFATLEEVKKALSSVIITNTVFKEWHKNLSPPMHYIVYDKSGKSIVIEPLDKTLKVYDNSVGVITNSPTFDWHMTNLNNYINLSPYNVTEGSLQDLPLKTFGQGSGMLGLPGDFTPPSRFIRAAFFSKSAVNLRDSQAAALQTFHILNQFDIPMGTVRSKERRKTSYDYTMFTSVKNPKTLKYYFRTYKDQAIKSICLKQFDLNAPNIKTLNIDGGQKICDVSCALK
ncbi:MAG: putative protein YxeI [Chlamydiia bacterium]|nr:putative protein YxeI [Chlamydiia bacterium]